MYLCWSHEEVFTVPGLYSTGTDMHRCCELMNIPSMSCIEGIFFLYISSSTFAFYFLSSLCMGRIPNPFKLHKHVFFILWPVMSFCINCLLPVTMISSSSDAYMQHQSMHISMNIWMAVWQHEDLAKTIVVFSFLGSMTSKAMSTWPGFWNKTWIL